MTTSPGAYSEKRPSFDELTQPASAEAGEEREVTEDVRPAALVVEARDALQPYQA